MSSITVTLPIPPRVLSPNARCHWRVKAKATKQYRFVAVWEACKECGLVGPRWKAARVQVRWFTKTKRRPDADNALASLKAAFDGLTDAGVWVSDRETQYEPIVFGVDKVSPRVEVEIMEVKP